MMVLLSIWVSVAAPALSLAVVTVGTDTGTLIGVLTGNGAGWIKPALSDAVPLIVNLNLKKPTVEYSYNWVPTLELPYHQYLELMAKN